VPLYTAATISPKISALSTKTPAKNVAQITRVTVVNREFFESGGHVCPRRALAPLNVEKRRVAGFG